MMPEMDGFMVAKIIREDPHFNPVTIMMLSSADRPDDFERCRNLGINLYVRKPVKHSEFWNAIQSALGRPGSKSTEIFHPALAQPPKLLYILLAEDNPVNQHMAVVLLEERGHRVQVANNGQEALDLWATVSPQFDLILMDVQMPVMDGFQATEAIRLQEQTTGDHIRIIAMTAHALKGDRERCLGVGMDDYIAKPVREEELLATVECWKMPESNSIELPPPAPIPAAKPILNWQAALERMRGKHKLLCKMMTLFQEQSPLLLADMANAIQQQDAKTMQRTAHTLKSSANSIGAVNVGNILQKLETSGQDANLSDTATQYQALEKAMIELEVAINAFLKEHIE
jgi:CheY-like chemotaxis protein